MQSVIDDPPAPAATSRTNSRSECAAYEARFHRGPRRGRRTGSYGPVKNWGGAVCAEMASSAADLAGTASTPVPNRTWVLAWPRACAICDRHRPMVPRNGRALAPVLASAVRLSGPQRAFPVRPGHIPCFVRGERYERSHRAAEHARRDSNCAPALAPADSARYPGFPRPHQGRRFVAAESSPSTI